VPNIRTRPVGIGCDSSNVLLNTCDSHVHRIHAESCNASVEGAVHCTLLV
jgi:hypothetical protein